MTRATVEMIGALRVRASPVLRRLDAVLADTKQAVLGMRARLDQFGIIEQDPVLRGASEQAFFTTSQITLSDLSARQPPAT